MGNLFKTDSVLKIIFYERILKNQTPCNLLRKMILGIGLCFAGDEAFTQQIIYQHDFGSTNITAYPYTDPPGIIHPSFTNSIWTNTTGSWISFAGSSGHAIGLRNNAVITLTFEIASGYQFTLSQFSFWCQSSNTGAQNWSMTIKGIPIGSGAVPQNGKSTGNVNVANPVSQLSGLITIEIALTGATSGTGTFRLDDFTLIGSVTANETYFQSRQNGDWSAATTWESSPDNINWYPATKAPAKDNENILIKAGHTVKVTNPVSFDQTTISGILDLQDGGVLNINDGVGDDLLVLSEGILRILTTSNYATSVNQSPGANINIAKGGKFTIGNGITAMGKGYEAFATSAVNKWNDGAVFEFNDNNVFVIAGQIYFPNVAINDIPIFRVSKVNGTIAAGSGNDFYLNGIIEVFSDVIFSGVGKKYFRNGIRGTATISQTGLGKFYITAAGSILDGPSLKINLAQPIDLAPATFIPFDAQVTLSGANLNNNFAGNVLEINGVLDVSTNGIGNTNGKIILNGTFKTAHPGGFSGSGSSIVSGNVVLNPNCTIELYANGNQSLNARDDFKNLIFSGSGVKKPTAKFSPNGTLLIKNEAIFDCSGNPNAINIGDNNTNLSMRDNSRLIVSGFGTNPQMNGLYDLIDGVIEFRGSLLTPQTIRNQTYKNIEVTGTNVNNSDGNIVLKNGGTFTVKSGAVFTINDNTITGPIGIQTVTVESGGTFKTGNTKGFHGFVFTSAPKYNSSLNADIENISLQPNSTIEYSRASPPLSSGDQPITNANNLIYQNLVLSGTGNKVAPSDNLFIQGNLSKTGTSTFVHNNGSVIFNGNAVQNYSSVSPQMVFNVLKNENTKGLNILDSLSVYKELSFADNSTLNLNADVTLISNKNQTASVSRLPANVKFNYGVGRFIVERYINTNVNGGHGKSWQLVSTPAFGETIFDTWQEKGNKNIAGYGTWITDVSGTDKGFDAVSFTPSMKYFDAKSNNWIGVSGTDINLENEKGYMIFVRGDRRANALNSPATPTVLRTRGRLYTPQSLPPVNIVPPASFQCVGNPFASVIDFSKINRSPEIENSFRVWDPEYYGVMGFGGYQTISAAIGYKAIPGGSSIYNTSDYRNIQSGQAFFVYNFTEKEGTVGFSEDCKITDAHHLVNRISTSQISETQILTTKLMLQNKVVDGNAVAFNKRFSNNIDNNDAVKINNGNENFGIKRNGKILIVEARQEIKAADTLFYHLENLSKQSYKLLFIPEKIQEGVEAFLLDQFLKTEIPVNLKDTSSVDFLITADAGSAIPNRFLMVFKSVIIPLKVSLNASEKNASVFLEWNISNENEIREYRVEHSTDGINFQLIEIISASINSTALYNYLHKEPENGNNYYRIRIDKTNGKSEYSDIVNIEMQQFDMGITVFPNPFDGQNLSIQLMHSPPGKYFLELINSSGQPVISKKFNHSGGNGLQTMNLNRKVPHGIYYLKIKNQNEEIKRLKLVY